MSPMRARHLFLLAAASCLALSSLSALASCAGKKTEITDSPNPKLTTKTIQVGSSRVLAEIARTETERERGLMFRKSLEDGEGMLFVFDKDEQLAFWMKNTFIPLSSPIYPRMGRSVKSSTSSPSPSLPFKPSAPCVMRSRCPRAGSTAPESASGTKPIWRGWIDPRAPA